MDGKFIKRKVVKVVVPILTLIVAASQLSGCSSSSKSQVVDTVNELGGDTQVEFLVEENEFNEQGEVQQLEWVPLSKLNTYPGYRAKFEAVMGVETKAGIKTGCIYVDAVGKHTDNPTLLTAFSNKATVEKFNDSDNQDILRAAVKNTYADIEDSDEYAAIINGYFNLLPDNTPNYFNGGKSLSRLEAMTVASRATNTAASNPTVDQSFKDAVGDTQYTSFAALSNANSFISTSDESLTQDNASKAMSKGEYIYLVMSSIYGEDAINSVDLSTSKLTDVKEVVPTEHTKTNAEQLALALQTPTQCPEAIYKALVLANENDLTPADTKWNTAITKTEAIELITEAIQSYNEKNGYKVNTDNAMTDTEAKAEAEAKEKEEIMKAYESVKDEITCDGDTFYKEYKEISKDDKLSTGEVIQKIVEKYKKPVVTTTAPAEVETTTTQAAQQQTPPSNGGGNSNSGGNNNGGGGTPQYVEPPQQQVTEPVYVPPVETPTQPPVVTPPTTQPPVATPPSGGGSDEGRAPVYDDEMPDVDWELDI